MLPEHINYYNNLPFSISFTNVKQEGPHYHKEMEMVLVLQGTVSYKVHHQDYHLQAGDLLVVDTEDLHHIYDSSEDILMLTIYIDLEFFNDLYPNIDFMIFACEECGGQSKSRQQELQNKLSFLKHNLAEIMMIRLTKENDSSLLMEKLREFIFIMVNQFQGFVIENNHFRANNDQINSLDLDRLYHIIKYIYVNYDKKITLDDLANLEHMNPYYVSHLIKNTSGLSFQKLLNYIRVEYAEKFLVENKYTLTQISEFCGFSSSSYFNKCFSSWHNMTPSQYKKQLVTSERTYHGEICQETAVSLLSSYLNVSHVDYKKEAELHASYHVFIPVKAEYPNGRKLLDVFPLHILLDSPSDILRVGYYKEQLRKLNPASIKISASALDPLPEKKQILGDLAALDLHTEIVNKLPRLRKSSPHHAAEAFSDCIEDPDSCLKLFGDESAIFTTNGIPTPQYSLYTLLADINGSVTEIMDQYVLIKDDSAVFIILYQKSNTQSLNVHLHLQDLKEDLTVISRTFQENHAASTILDNTISTYEITPRLRDHIYRVIVGETEFSCINTKSNPKLDMIIKPGTLMIMEFSI